MSFVLRYNETANRERENKPTFIYADTNNKNLEDDECDTNKRENETKCGVFSCRPSWLQIFASKKSFVVAYTLVLSMLYCINAYFMGTISTVEKNYRMSSKMLGSIKGSAEIGSLFFNLILTYFVGKGHKGKWLALGMIVAGLSSCVRILPFFHYEPAENVKMHTKEYSRNFLYRNFTEQQICDEYIDDNLARNFAFKIFLVAQILLEIAAVLLKTAGAVYLDDNTRKNIFPFLFTLTHALRSVGVTIGFLLASYTLTKFVNPDLTPNINNPDPRWIGAWWLGWIPIGIACFIMAGFLFLFPQTLPRAAERKKKLPQQKIITPASVKDYIASAKRILKNKMVLLDSFSSICFKIGLAAYEIFLPKYIESQFGLTSSNSNFLVGFVAFAGKSFGILIVGLIITFFKPSPRKLMGCNLFVGILSVFVHLSHIFINCSRQQIQGHWNPDRSWNHTEECNVNLNCNNKYSPVCYNEKKYLYYSSCHAGCSSSRNDISKTFTRCFCAPNSGPIVEGLCHIDCSSYAITFLIVLGIFRLIRTSNKSIKKIIRFRFVEENDKSLSLGINRGMLAILAAFPSPILYGFIIDWTCIVFEETCGKTGNCWFYDTDKLRYTLNLTASAFLTIGTILDGFLWYHTKHLKIYDEDFEENQKTSQDHSLETEQMVAEEKTFN